MVLLQLLDVAGDVNGLQLFQIVQAARLAPRGKAGDGFHISASGMAVADAGGEEVDKALGGLGSGVEKNGERGAGELEGGGRV